MKRKTAFIQLGLTSAMAMMLGCRGNARRCIDPSNRVVEDRYCEGSVIGSRDAYPYRWYYGGSGFGSGMFVSGGSYGAYPGSSSSSASSGTSSSGTTRGGFGSTASGARSSGSGSGAGG